MVKLGPVIDESRYVTRENGPRPAGRPDRCFYCHRTLGEAHANDCVLVVRRVRLRFTVEYEIRVPADWDIEQVEFHRNESTWCMSNVISELEERYDLPGGPCLCASGARLEVVDFVEKPT